MLLKLGSFFLDKKPDYKAKENIPTTTEQSTQLNPSAETIVESAENTLRSGDTEIRLESYPNSDITLESTKTDNCSGEWRYVLPEGLYAYLGSIRMRKDDKSDTEVLYRNTKVCALGESDPPQGSEYSEPWSKIIYNGQYWWVSSGYLVSNRVVFSDCDNFSRAFTVAGASSLNVRQGINNLNNSRIIGVLEEGSNVCPIDYKLIDQSGWADDWVKIRLTNGDSGWVAEKYLQEN